MALGKGSGRIGIWVDKNMQVVKGRHQLDMLRQQHTVAKNIAAHIANTNHREILFLDIHTHLAEVSLHSDPGTPRGNTHPLVVVAVAATGGKGITEPEVIGPGNIIGCIGESSCALVCRHHQVGIAAIATDHIHRRNHLAIDQVIADIQQRLHIEHIAGNALLQPGLATIVQGSLLGNKTALGTGGNNYRIFHLLCLDQPQHLGAVILHPVGPAQATAGHLATPQMDPFHSR